MKTSKNFLLKTTLAVAFAANQINSIFCWSFPYSQNRKSNRGFVFCDNSTNCTDIDPHSSCINGRCLCTGNIYRRFIDGCLPAGGDQTVHDGSSEVFNILVPFFAFFIAAVAVLLFALFRMRVRGSRNGNEVTLSTEGTDRIVWTVERGSDNCSCEEAKEDFPPAYNELDLPPPPYEVVVLESKNCDNKVTKI